MSSISSQLVKSHVQLDDGGGNTSINTVMPYVCVKHSGSTTEIQKFKWAVDDDTSKKRVSLVKGYTNFVTDLDYITRKHVMNINGKIEECEKAQLGILDCVEGDKVLGHLYRPDCYRNQRIWCHRNMCDMMLGISTIHKLPVNLINKEALLILVSRIDTKQEADRMYSISNFWHFALVVKPMTMRNEFAIDTIFDDRFRRSRKRDRGHFICCILVVMCTISRVVSGAVSGEDGCSGKERKKGWI
jgi:hypothetical protein